MAHDDDALSGARLAALRAGDRVELTIARPDGAPPVVLPVRVLRDEDFRAPLFEGDLLSWDPIARRPGDPVAVAAWFISVLLEAAPMLDVVAVELGVPIEAGTSELLRRLPFGVLRAVGGVALAARHPDLLEDIVHVFDWLEGARDGGNGTESPGT